MRIFYSFMIIVCATILLLLPVSSGVYDFRTDERTDSFAVTTAVATTNATVQLLVALYNNDPVSLSFTSNNTDDNPTYSSYNATSRALGVAGLAANSTHTLGVTYDIDAVTGSGLDTFMDYLPYIWIIIWVAFPIAGLAAIWIRRRD